MRVRIILKFVNRILIDTHHAHRYMRVLMFSKHLKKLNECGIL